MWLPTKQYNENYQCSKINLNTVASRAYEYDIDPHSKERSSREAMWTRTLYAQARPRGELRETTIKNRPTRLCCTLYVLLVILFYL